MVAETCPDCGAERPSWHGGSHVRRCLKHGVSHKVCCDGRSPDQVWKTDTFSYMGDPIYGTTQS